MGKIFYLMGKSACGKDSLHKALLEDPALGLKSAVLYTTRPMRENEVDGVDYFFVTEEQVSELEKSGKILEMRTYDTIYGPWKYLTVDDGQFDEDADYLMIGTLASYETLQKHFGKERLIPLYIEVEDGERLRRALNRERKQSEPKYAEMCRRFLADEKDFSPENLERAGITISYKNRRFPVCLNTMKRAIKKQKKKNETEK